MLLEEKSDLCLVVGDVTSTMACSIVAQKLHVPVAHVEAGIRSGDWTMPEEINRMVTEIVEILKKHEYESKMSDDEDDEDDSDNYGDYGFDDLDDLDDIDLSSLGF
mgnify:CR=1 FL=1